MHDRTTWADVWRKWRPEGGGRRVATWAAVGAVLLGSTAVAGEVADGETTRDADARLSVEAAAQAAELTAVEAEMSELADELAATRERLDAETSRRAGAEREVAQLRADARDLDRELASLEDQLQRLELPTSGQSDVAEPEATPSTQSEAQTMATAVLRVTHFSDGDSFTASDGNEYRLGLVNTPEAGEACAEEATAFTRGFLANGFTAEAYATDRWGRLVAEVRDGAGASLNEALAANGLGDDRYLDEFRHENPDLAARLDALFASADTPPCRAPAPEPEPEPEPAPTSEPPPPQPAPEADGCHPAYETCIPIKGDGSGDGDANDLDCGDIRQKVRVRNPGNDPYRLDRDGDGWGCESYG